MNTYFNTHNGLRTLSQLALRGRRVLVRADLNVPIKDGKILDPTRIEAALPTLKALLEGHNKVVLMSHLGRPEPDAALNQRYSLRVVAKTLSQRLSRRLHFCSGCVGHEAEKQVELLPYGEALLLENVRAHKEETDNEKTFAHRLAAYADVYINDAFGTLHRAHASTEAVARLIKEKGVGLLVQRECEHIYQVINNPARPFCCLLGGSKVSDKIDLIEALLPLSNSMLIGGAMAFSFMHARGMSVGQSKVETDKITLVRHIETQARALGVALYLPVDLRVGHRSNDSEPKVVAASAIPSSMSGFDIGPETEARFGSEIQKSRTLVWNGPMGVYEEAPFAGGTKAVLSALVAATKAGAFSLAGGGDSVAALNAAGYHLKDLTHLSTGGGAMLAFLQGKPMPALEALKS